MNYACWQSCTFVSYYIYLDLEWDISPGSWWSPEHGHQLRYKKKAFYCGEISKATRRYISDWGERPWSWVFPVNYRRDYFLYSVLGFSFLHCIFLVSCSGYSKVWLQFNSLELVLLQESKEETILGPYLGKTVQRSLHYWRKDRLEATTGKLPGSQGWQSAEKPRSHWNVKKLRFI